MHRDGWEIHIINNQVWFTPPADIDPTQTPRLGGQDRYGYTHAA